MKIRNIGLINGLVIGGLLMLGGWALTLGGEPGIAILAGILFFAGALLVAVTFFSWLFTSVYSSINPKNRWVFWLVIPLLGVGFIGILKVNDYLRSQPAAIAKRAAKEQARAEAEAIRMANIKKAAMAKQQAEAEECRAAQASILGKWAYEKSPNSFVVFEEQGMTYFDADSGWLSKGNWELYCTHDPSGSMSLQLHDFIARCQECAITSWDSEVLRLDSKQLIVNIFYNREKTTYNRVIEAGKELKQ